MSSIYKITNLVTQQVYIGQATDVKNRFIDYSKRLAKGQPMLNKSLLTYGVRNHKFEVLCTCLDSIADKLEIFFIKYYKSYYYQYRNRGMNLTRGGRRGSAQPEETKRKIAKSLTGKKQTTDTIHKKRAKNSKPVEVFNKDGSLYKRFNSAVEAGEHFGVSDNSIRDRIRKTKAGKSLDYIYKRT